MKFECIKEKLQKAISSAERATGKKLPLVVLGNILIEADDKGINIRATNLDLGVDVNIPTKVTKKGRVALNGSIVDNYLSNLAPQTIVSVELVGNNLSLTTSTSSVLISTIDSSDFPQLPIFSKEDKTINLILNVKDFEYGLQGTIFAVSPSDIKQELAGIYIYTKNNDIIFSATDSFRLSERRIVGNKDIELEPGIIIPTRTAGELLRLISGEEGEITIKYNKNQISFQNKNWYLTSRLIEGNFPNYEHLIPSSFKTQVVVLKDELLSALRLTNIFTDRFHQINIKVIPDDNLFEVRTKNQEIGESTVRVDATIEGEPVELSINARYLLDCFPIINKDSLTLGFNSKDKAMLVRAVGDRSFSYLVMPLNR